MTTSNWKGTLSLLAVALLPMLAPAAASAQLRLGCPVDWSALSGLNGSLDREVLGVPVRDWRTEYLAQMRQRMEACFASSGWPESLKAATREDAARLAQNAQRALEQRDRALASERGQADAAQAAARSNIPGVSVDPRGRLTIAAPELREQRGCGSDPEDFRSLARGRREVYVAFLNLCSQLQQLSPEQTARAQRFLNDLQNQDRELSAFVSRVASLKAAPHALTHGQLRQLELDGDAVGEKLRRRPLTYPEYDAAVKDLRSLRRALDERECPEYMRRAGLPNDLLRAQYLIERRNPDDLENIVCWATRNGAKVRYLIGGLGRKEGFEIAGKITVQVRAERVIAPDSRTIILVPVEGAINGEQALVTDENFQFFNQHVINAIQNR